MRCGLHEKYYIKDDSLKINIKLKKMVVPLMK